MSPIETAIETLDSTNKKLSSAVEQQITDPSTKIGTLGMLLNGVVDAAVQGGISNWKHFYADDYGTSEKEKGFGRRLKDLTKEQVKILFMVRLGYGIIVFLSSRGIFLASAGYLCKEIGPRSGPMKLSCRS